MAAKEQETLYTITLADESQLTGLKLNGNNFISTDEVTEDTFKGKLGHVSVTGGEETWEGKNLKLVQISKVGSEYWFILRELSAAELSEMQLRSDMDYVAMMCDVEI